MMTSSGASALLVIRSYQLLLAPFAGGACRFEPSCSVYALEADRDAWRCARTVAGAAPRSRVSSVRPPVSIRFRRATSRPRRELAVRYTHLIMEKRVFLAIFLSFAVLAVYQAYFAPAPPKPPQHRAPATARRERRAPTARPLRSRRHAAGHGDPRRCAARGDAAARDIVVETDTVSRGVQTEGAVLKSWRLKKYLGRRASRSSWCRRIFPTRFRGRSRSRPTTRRCRRRCASALYQPSADQLSLGSAPGTLTFRVPRRVRA